MELKNSHIMITGANRGIGKAFAKVCAEDKAHLHLVVRKKEAALIKEFESLGAASVTLWQADLSQRSSIEKHIKATENLKIDILFNNAGMLTADLLENQSMDEIYDVFQTNLTALVHLTHAYLPGMLKRKHGKIINNSSIAALLHVPFSSTYSASKAGVLAFTNCLKAELRGTGVSTLLLVTPAVKTRLFEEIEKRYKNNFEIPEQSLNPQIFAKMIREAVLHDLETVEPQGFTGLGLRLVKYVPKLFDWEVRRRFQRKPKKK